MWGLAQEVPDYDINKLCSTAVEEGQTECVRLLMGHGIPLEGWLSEMSVLHRKFSCLQLARELGDDLQSAVMMAAVAGTCSSRCLLN
jgi:hypothetical protein